MDNKDSSSLTIPNTSIRAYLKKPWRRGFLGVENPRGTLGAKEESQIFMDIPLQRRITENEP